MATKTLKFEFQSRNNNESLSPAITVVDDSGSVQTTGTMSHSYSGKYVYDFTATVGEYYYAKIIAEGRTVVSPLYYVEATVTSSSVIGVTPASGSYTSTLETVRVAGIQTEVVDENVGTGDNSETDFDLDNKNIIASSYSLYYGASGSNDMTELTETTHYTLDKDSGRVLLTASGVTELGTQVLYAKYTYSEKMSDTMIAFFITKSDAEVEKITGRIYGTTATYTEYINGQRDSYKSYPTTDEPYMSDYDEPDYVNLSKLPVASVQSVYFLGRGYGFANVQSYDDSAGTYTDNTTEANEPSGTAFDVFASTPASDDAIYLGMDYRFMGFNMKFSQLGAGSPTLAFEYWDGSSWTAVSGESDGTSDMSANGKVTYSMFSGWTKKEINGSNSLYFIRIRLASGSFSTVPKCYEIAPENDSVIQREIPMRQIDYTDFGEVTFLSHTIPDGVRNIRVDYTYGESTIPALIGELSALLATLRIFSNITGGSYDDMSGYQIGSKQVSIGEVYVNVREVVRQVEERIKMILLNFPKRVEIV